MAGRISLNTNPKTETEIPPAKNQPSKTGPAKPDLAPVASVPSVDTELRDVSGGKLTAFAAFPVGVSFSGEEDKEKVVLLLRQHPITNLPWILASIAFLLLPFFLFSALLLTGTVPPLPTGFKMAFILFWYLGTVTYAFLNFLYWYFNVYIVTDERVVDTDWYSVIYRKVSSALITKIQDISSTQSGVFAGIFDYGDVNIETAGEEPNFDFSRVAHPQLVAKKLEEMMQDEGHKGEDSL